jgi:hypothetical protein
MGTLVGGEPEPLSERDPGASGVLEPGLRDDVGVCPVQPHRTVT